MDLVQNLLYRHPEAYDAAFPDRISSRFFLRALEKYGRDPRSILDLGCGTGNTLEVIARQYPDCVGVDLAPAMVEYGRKARPSLRLESGDMRKVRLKRTFDGIGCFGWAFSYNLEDSDVAATMETFRAHSHAGTVLAFDCAHAEPYFSSETLPPVSLEVDKGVFRGKATASFELDRKRKLLKRRRVWEIPGQAPVEDYCQYRLHDPGELKTGLESVGFEVMELAGDPEGTALAPGEKTLYCVAVKK